MDVASLCAFPVGIARWRAAEPSLTVIVKATLRLDRGVAALSKQQEPLSLDRRGAPEAEAALEYATDFAPWKARADLVVVGHARAGAPATAIPVRVAADALDKRCFALAARPSERIPLAGHLRDGPSSDARPRHLGPRDWYAAASASSDGALISPEGPPRAALPARFDFGLFNAAPPDQQLAALDPAMTLTLHGLLPGAAERQVRLSGIEPVVFCYTRSSDLPEPLPLRCDTLWIDTDRALCTLVFRGLLVSPEAHEASPRHRSRSGPIRSPCSARQRHALGPVVLDVGEEVRLRPEVDPHLAGLVVHAQLVVTGAAGRARRLQGHLRALPGLAISRGHGAVDGPGDPHRPVRIAVDVGDDHLPSDGRRLSMRPPTRKRTSCAATSPSGCAVPRSSTSVPGFSTAASLGYRRLARAAAAPASQRTEAARTGDCGAASRHRPSAQSS